MMLVHYLVVVAPVAEPSHLAGTFGEGVGLVVVTSVRDDIVSPPFDRGRENASPPEIPRSLQWLGLADTVRTYLLLPSVTTDDLAATPYVEIFRGYERTGPLRRRKALGREAPVARSFARSCSAPLGIVGTKSPGGGFE